MNDGDPYHYSYNGELSFDLISWLPGGRYVLLSDRSYGVIVLEPATNKMGLLKGARADSLGWFQDIIPESAAHQEILLFSELSKMWNKFYNYIHDSKFIP